MRFEVMYETPPMRGIFRTEINADNSMDAEEKIRTNPEIVIYRIREINEMTLEQAILHCEEKACGNSKCGQEHKQLAEWLKELKQYRENTIS